MGRTYTVFCLAVLWAFVQPAAADAPSYSQVHALFAKHCLSCHDAKEAEGGLVLETHASLLKGGDTGPAIVPGKSADSLLVRQIEHREKPFMPPRGEEPVTPEELAIVKLWIDQGAKAPSGMRIRPKVLVGVPPATVQPVRAVAVSPDKAIIAAGRSNQIHIYDAGSGTHIRTLVAPGLKSHDGKDLIAAAGSKSDASIQVNPQPDTNPAAALRRWFVTRRRFLRLENISRAVQFALMPAVATTLAHFSISSRRYCPN